MASLEVNYELDQDFYPTLDPTQQQRDDTLKAVTALKHPQVKALGDRSPQLNDERGMPKRVEHLTGVTPSPLTLVNENNSSIDCIEDHRFPSTPVSNPGRDR